MAGTAFGQKKNPHPSADFKYNIQSTSEKRVILWVFQVDRINKVVQLTLLCPTFLILCKSIKVSRIIKYTLAGCIQKIFQHDFGKMYPSRMIVFGFWIKVEAYL